MQCASQLMVLLVFVSLACQMFLPLDYSYVIIAGMITFRLAIQQNARIEA